ncbi:hypothetical protein VTI74DRAFT_9397 [Chaetomium olivicolor]
MRIAKPGSANNSPRTSALQSRRRTLIGDGFQGRPQTRSPAMDQVYLPTPASETPNEPFYTQQTGPARPLSWHPSSQPTQQWLLPYQDSSCNTTPYPYPTYSDAEMLASLQQIPPTPAVYSGYASPASSFSPLSLPYSNFSSQPICSPLSQPLPVQQDTPLLDNYPSADTLSEIPYLPPPHVTDGSIGWDPYATSNAILSRQTAPPTPEDFSCGLLPNQPPQQQQQQQQQREQEQKQEQEQRMKQEPAVTVPQTYEPLIHNEDDDEPEGEILYGMGLYDAPDHNKGHSVVLSLFGGAGDQKEADTGKGLGLKLEDAWEPPASEDEDGEDDDGEGQEEDDR